MNYSIIKQYLDNQKIKVVETDFKELSRSGIVRFSTRFHIERDYTGATNQIHLYWEQISNFQTFL